MRALWVLFSLIPGAPAIARGRVWSGSALLLLGFAGWDLAILGAYLVQGPVAEPARVTGLAVGVTATLLSVIWTLRMTSRRRRDRLRAQTIRALEHAQTAYLLGDLATARSSVRDGLRIDARDIDLIHLEWHLARDRGDQRVERRTRRRLRRLDLDEKWVWELDREEAVGER